MKTNVCFLVSALSGRSFWRCEEPARLLNEMCPDRVSADIRQLSSGEFPSHVEVKCLSGYDVLIVQGGGYRDPEQALRVLKQVREAGVRLVYEIDDDFDHLSRTNPSYFAMTPAARRVNSWLREECDLIIASTPNLATVLGAPEKTVVIENALDYARFPGVPAGRSADAPILVLWHGSESHEAGLQSIEKELFDFVTNRRPKLEEKTGRKIIVAFMGYLPQLFDSYLKRGVQGPIVDFHLIEDPLLKREFLGGRKDLASNQAPGRAFIVKGRMEVRYIPPVPVQDFHQALIALNPDICICPIEPHDVFSVSKSSIKVQESALAGAASVVTTMTVEADSRSLGGPFNQLPDDCVMKTRTSAQMLGAVQELILNPEKRLRLAAAADEYFREKHDLRRNVGQWADALSDKV